MDGKPFSVGLVAAVGFFRSLSYFSSELTDRQAMRQSTFTDKVHMLGWLDSEFFENPESALVLQHCIVRYYGLVVFLVSLFSTV